MDAAARSSLAGLAARMVSDSVVEVRFDRAYAEQLYDATWHVRVIPRHIWEPLSRPLWAADTAIANLVGSGPYRVVRWDSGQSLTLERAPPGQTGPARVGRPLELWVDAPRQIHGGGLAVTPFDGADVVATGRIGPTGGRLVVDPNPLGPGRHELTVRTGTLIGRLAVVVWPRWALAAAAAALLLGTTGVAWLGARGTEQRWRPDSRQAADPDHDPENCLEDGESGDPN